MRDHMARKHGHLEMDRFQMISVHAVLDSTLGLMRKDSW